MPALLIAPTEPPQLQALGTSSPLAEEYGADILIPGNGFFLGLQRKTFPADFLASLQDGRLASSLQKLSRCEVRLLILEGKPAWNGGGYLMNYDYNKGGEFKRSTLRALLASALYQLGVGTIHTDHLTDTVAAVTGLAEWADKRHHHSLFARPNISGSLPRNEDSRRRDEALRFLQGFEGFGPELAGAIYDHFGRLPLSWTVTAEDLLAIPGLGPERVTKLTRSIPAPLPPPKKKSIVRSRK